jgi:hypothetical protein
MAGRVGHTGRVTEDDQESGAGQPSVDQIRIERARPWVRDVQFAEQAALIMRVPDEALLAATIDAGAIQPSNHFAMEMQWRLKDAVQNLTAEEIRSRESSERLTGQLDASIASLTAETVAARESSDRTARRLVWLTVVLVVLTTALVTLTVVLAVR